MSVSRESVKHQPAQAPYSAPQLHQRASQPLQRLPTSAPQQPPALATLGLPPPQLPPPLAYVQSVATAAGASEAGPPVAEAARLALVEGAVEAAQQVAHLVEVVGHAAGALRLCVLCVYCVRIGVVCCEGHAAGAL